MRDTLHELRVDASCVEGVVLAPTAELHASFIKLEKPARPVLRVDDDHAGRTHDDVIEVCGRARVLAAIVEDVPTRTVEHVQPTGDLELTLVA